MMSLKMKLVAPLVAFTVAGVALAADDHDHKPKYGGVVTEVKEIQYELVAKPDSIAIFVEDHGKKVEMKGGSTSVMFLSAKDKFEVKLAPAGGNKLEAKGSFKLSPGTKGAALVSLPGKPAQTVRFTLK